MSEKPRLHHVGIVVDDIEEAAKFMREVIGLDVGEIVELGPQYGQLAWVELENIRLELIKYHDKEIELKHTGGLPAIIEHICFETDDADRDHARLEAQGVTFRGPINSANDRRTFFTDPDSTDGVIYQYRQQIEDVGMPTS